MNELGVVRPGFFTTVQDRGRRGFRVMGIGRAGALDEIALEIANLMAGNRGEEAVLEIALGEAEFVFTDTRRFAICGADCRAALDGAAVAPWASGIALSGQRLVFHRAASGARSILAVAGGIDVPLLLGSRSTDVRGAFGGLDGRALRAGDSIPLGSVGFFQSRAAIRVAPPDRIFDARRIAVLPAPEYGAFETRSREHFWQERWTVTAQSDRMGLRLQGAAVRYAAHAWSVESHAVLPGVIQIPPAGQPVVLLNDAPTTGGYPKFGVVCTADLWKLSGARAGAELRFERASYEQAGSARTRVARYVETVRASVEARLRVE